MGQLEPKAGTRPSAECFEHTRCHSADMDTHSRTLQNLSDDVPWSGGNLRHRRLKQLLSFHTASQWDRAPIRLALWVPFRDIPGLMSPISFEGLHPSLFICIDMLPVHR